MLTARQVAPGTRVDAVVPAALVSVHDVMPETLDACRHAADWLERLGTGRITLLVVPGRAWDERSLAALREMERRGHRLAGHGWSHRALPARSLRARLYGRLVSRDAGEHLERPAEEVLALLSDCHRWFTRCGLTPPTLYVPPAWVMGRVDHRGLREAGPFAMYESLSALLRPAQDRRVRLPLAGFQADTPGRARFLSRWNRLNEAWARRSGRPLRVAVHPGDLELPLASGLRGLLERCARFVDYEDV